MQFCTCSIVYFHDEPQRRTTDRLFDQFVDPSIDLGLSRSTFHSDEILRKRSGFDQICDTVTVRYLRYVDPTVSAPLSSIDRVEARVIRATSMFRVARSAR